MHYDATKTLGRIPLPTLVVVGDQDSVTRGKGAAHQSGIQSAQLITLAPAKHLGLSNTIRGIQKRFASSWMQSRPRWERRSVNIYEHQVHGRSIARVTTTASEPRMHTLAQK